MTRKTSAIYVLTETKRPLMLHRTDCPHPPHGAKFRPAASSELSVLPTCFHCAAADARDRKP
jgi:hypothetical protein